MQVDVAELALEEHEQLALAAAYAALMRAELAASPADGLQRVYDGLLSELANGPLGASTGGRRPLDCERQEGLEDLLATVTSTTKSLAILVELAASQPFAEQDHLLAESERSCALEEIAIRLGGNVDEDDIERVDSYLDEARRAANSSALKWWLIGAGALAGLATGGLAAPAIGAAIGSAMGLSGAAATGAGLALLGGGSLAAGGFGMAGGTLLVTGVGGLIGAGAGARLQALSGMATSGRLDAEAVKLFAVVRSADFYLASDDPERPSMAEIALGGRLALDQLRDGLRLRAAQVDRDQEAAEALREAAKVAARLRSRLGDLPKGS